MAEATRSEEEGGRMPPTDAEAGGRHRTGVAPAPADVTTPALPPHQDAYQSTRSPASQPRVAAGTSTGTRLPTAS